MYTGQIHTTHTREECPGATDLTAATFAFPRDSNREDALDVKPLAFRHIAFSPLSANDVGM
jgi:hypothetical protein